MTNQMKISQRIIELCSVLYEARRDRYLQMMDRFLPAEDKQDAWGTGDIDGVKKSFSSDIDWAIKNLEREDRIIWFLRYAQFYYWNQLLSKLRKRYPEYKAKFETWYREMESRYGFPEKNTRFYQYIQEHLDDLKGVFTHFLGMPIKEFQDHRFTNDSLELFKQWHEIAQNYTEEKPGISRSAEEQRHGVEDFIEFPDGWKWILKHTPVCSLEGNAMDHCGNRGASMRPDDELLSLRSPTDEEDMWEPHLTVVLNNGVLRDMVGKHNAPPSSKFKKYVKALVDDPRIEDMEDKPDWV